jgi:2-polyprenyl-3-methyl-5-hydroxy-6-metoxy-1,4-benzoquinol methylase
MSAYYFHERTEILPIVPKSASSILEIGAASGKTLRWIKTVCPGVKTTGVELNGDLAEELGRNADVAIIANIADCLPKLGKYDLILLLDVLEHLQNPTEVLRSLRKLLAAGGQIIVSVPNVAHLSVAVPLLMKRQFTYQDSGILDRTHLTFFVEDSAVKLMNDAGLTVTKGLITGLQGTKAKLLNYLSLGALRHHLTKQYIMLGEACESKPSQGPIQWMTARQ